MSASALHGSICTREKRSSGLSCDAGSCDRRSVSRGRQARRCQNSPQTSNFFFDLPIDFTSTRLIPHHNVKMPKSKRAKVVHLSKTEKKGKELSLKTFAKVQEAADNFQYIFVFAVENMRNSYLKAIRAEFSDSRYTVCYAIVKPFLIKA
jgi:hypothetical protein